MTRTVGLVWSPSIGGLVIGEEFKMQEPGRDAGDAPVVRAVFDEMPLGLLALEGPELRFVAANAAYRSFIGRDAILGRPMREVLPDLDGQQVLELVERVYATGEPASLPELRLQRVLDDGGVPQEAFVDVTLAPRPGVDGATSGVLVHFVDVTRSVQARRAAQHGAVVAQRRYEHARDVIATLQRELLPAGLPVLPGTRIAASYLLADDEHGADGVDGGAAGGDWFDAVPRPGGRVALVVGDVVGHGVGASAVMGQLRAVLADRLDEGVDLAEAVEAVDRFARRTREARAATVAVVELDPVDGTLIYVLAGHPPPLLVPAAGEPHYLPGTGAGPLGTGPRRPFVVGTARLGVQDLVLLYSDGIVERPGRAPAAATVELAQVAADTAAGRGYRAEGMSAVERVCLQTLEMLVRVTGHTDDITLLAAQRVTPSDALALTLPSVVSTVPAARLALEDWLTALGASDEDTFAVLHAVGELVTNSVEHAYADRPGGMVAVHAALTDAGAVRITVTDQGSWHDTPADPQRGRGLAMTRDLVDDLDVERGPGGTTATVTHRLSRPARLLTSRDLNHGLDTPARPRAASTLLIADRPTRTDTPGVRVEGALDATTTARLHRELLQRTRGGTRALTVDLTGVTHLASAAVSVLHDLTGGARAALMLYAPAGSIAQHVLALVALPHTTADPDLPAAHEPTV